MPSRARRVRALLLVATAAGALGAASLVIAFLVLPNRSARALAELTPEVTYYVANVSDAVALTIDDGPDPAETPKILDALRAHSARATFFLIGGRVSGNEKLVTRMVEEGHELGNHDFYERVSAWVAAESLARGLDATHDVLTRFSPIRWFRPGSGVFTSDLLKIAHDRDYRVALGDVFPIDPRVPFPAFHSWYILRHAEPGSIIILHDAGGRGERTAATLRRVLPILAQRGLDVVTLSELAGAPHPTSPEPARRSRR